MPPAKTGKNYIDASIIYIYSMKFRKQAFHSLNIYKMIYRADGDVYCIKTHM